MYGSRHGLEWQLARHSYLDPFFVESDIMEGERVKGKILSSYYSIRICDLKGLTDRRRQTAKAFEMAEMGPSKYDVHKTYGVC